MAFSGRPRGPARIRVAPQAHGAAAGGRAPGSRPAPLRSAPGPGPGPGRASTIGDSAGGRYGPGPSPLYEPAAGPSRARSALSRDPRLARRARGPRGARCDAASVRVVCDAADVWATIGCSGRGRCRTEAALRYGSRPIRAWSALSRDPRCAARARPPEGLAAPPAGGRGSACVSGEARGDATAFPPASSSLGPRSRGSRGGTCAPRRSRLPVCGAQHHWQCVIGPRPNRCRRLNPLDRVYRVTS
jgi:hypothetical protein